MATEGRDDGVLDTSVLVNFLAVDRADLLAGHAASRFVIVDHVRGEITEHYPDQLERLERALAAGVFAESSVDALDAVFATLVGEGRLGIGECAAIALAAKRNIVLAIDDKQARKAAQRVVAGIKLESTETLMVALIRQGLLDVGGADAIKERWEAEFRFKLMFGSFAERI
jgi:predicted nucleic acid-binding protein